MILKPDFEIKHSTFHFCGTHLIKNKAILDYVISVHWHCLIDCMR